MLEGHTIPIIGALWWRRGEQFPTPERLPSVPNPVSVGRRDAEIAGEARDRSALGRNDLSRLIQRDSRRTTW